MDDKTKKICDLLTLIVVCFTFVPLFLINVEHQLGIFIIFLLLFCSLLIRSFFVGERFLNQYNWEKPLLFLEFFLVTVIVLLDRSTLSQILYYILIADAVLFYNLRFSLPYTALIIVSFSLSFYIRGYYEDWSQLLLGGLVNSLSFIFVFLLFYMLRHQIEQRNLIVRTRDEIEHKNKQLQKAFNSLEEMAILRERNRIAREVHDTIGHTLTTVLMGLEACRRLLDADSEETGERLAMVQDQVRKGLQELQDSIRKINERGDIIDMESAVEELLNETRRQTGVDSHKEISTFSPLNSQVKKIMLRVLQEGITNAIKHGECTELEVRIDEDEDYIYLLLQDNGRGESEIEYGFGLNSMEERIGELGGELSVSSTKGEGFELLVKLPLEGNKNEKH